MIHDKSFKEIMKKHPQMYDYVFSKQICDTTDELINAIKDEDMINPVKPLSEAKEGDTVGFIKKGGKGKITIPKGLEKELRGETTIMGNISPEEKESLFKGSEIIGHISIDADGKKDFHIEPTDNEAYEKETKRMEEKINLGVDTVTIQLQERIWYNNYDYKDFHDYEKLFPQNFKRLRQQIIDDKELMKRQEAGTDFCDSVMLLAEKKPTLEQFTKFIIKYKIYAHYYISVRCDRDHERLQKYANLMRVLTKVIDKKLDNNEYTIEDYELHDKVQPQEHTRMVDYLLKKKREIIKDVGEVAFDHFCQYKRAEGDAYLPTFVKFINKYPDYAYWHIAVCGTRERRAEYKHTLEKCVMAGLIPKKHHFVNMLLQDKISKEETIKNDLPL